MAVNYSQVTQDDHDRNDDQSPAISFSPALSSSPMPFLPSVESTFTPLSMNSDFYSSYEFGQQDDVAHSHHSAEKFPAPSGLLVTATAMVQSVTTSARATTRNNEYDLLSPGDADVDAGSSVSSSPNLRNTSPDIGAQQRDPLLLTSKSGYRQTFGSDTTSPSTAATQKPAQDHIRDPACTSAKVSSASEDNSNPQRDLQHTTIIRPKPILRTASTKSVTLVHPSVRTRSSSHTSNIAQLEATAEKLSMTSSIEDAIRDLHEEQKRSDSRRSSILAASVGSGPDPKDPLPFTRQLSSASSILEINNVARHGGYSPAGYVMSPNNSMLSNPSRLRSESHTTRSEVESDSVLSRNAPGHSSVRSARSTTKPSLTDIAEWEPTGLTLAAMDEADKLEEEPEEEEAVQLASTEDVELTPYAEGYNMSNAHDYWDQAIAEARTEKSQHQGDERPGTSDGSTGTFEQAERAFADFDGAHCSPEFDDGTFEPSPGPEPTAESPPDEDATRTMISRPTQPTTRPKSYMDPATGQQMLYYPARVPVMLNLPQKLSKKPKTAATNKRKSQLLSAMPEANRKSAIWLPEILPEAIPEPLFDPLASGSNSNLSTPLPRADSSLEHAAPSEDQPQSQARPDPRPLDEEATRSRMSVMDPADKRKSRMSYALGNLPPQLRASAFFDMPSTETPAIALKDGSAMATLDSILDASAKAPVSAFTDHTFAGRLGNEVYGTEKKRKSYMKRASTAEVPEVKKRSSFFHLRTPSKLSSKGSSKADKRSTTTSAAIAEDDSGPEYDERTRLSASVDGEPAAGANEGEDEEDEEGQSDEDLVLNGPPTTLLAELQMRKQQQKLRTRPVASAYPNGLHSTLLDIDTVAEVERKNRQGKKINLAWEEPNVVENESDDDDVPLGLLAAAKKGGMDMVTAQAELNRPLGLMERRALEDNEPLSRRRDRLQGRDPDLRKRQSRMTLGAHSAFGMSGDLGVPSPITPDEEEVEGETLAERLHRLKVREEGENALPRARPVSQAFSAEIFRQFGDASKGEDQAESKDKGLESAAPPEDEETLGQRRRRLQAEREAREKEMGGAPGMPTLTKRQSLADVLGTNRGRTVLSDPRADAERARQAELERFRRDQELKFATHRAQMPTNLISSNLQRSGGYMAGQFNDGNGGVRSSVYGPPTPVMGSTMGMNGGARMNGPVMGGGSGGYGIRAVGGAASSYGMPNGYGVPVTNNYGMPVQMPMQMMPMPMQQPGQQYDRVDRWRQSIVP